MQEDDPLLKSLDILEAKLQELDAQLIKLHDLQQERDQTYALVTQLRFFKKLGPYHPPDSPDIQVTISPFTQAPIKTLGRKMNLWEYAKSILEQAGKPLDLDDILESVKGLSGNVPEGRSGKETLRSVLHKRPEVFKRTQDGKYFLVK